jgi:hypothetical protein
MTIDINTLLISKKFEKLEENIANLAWNSFSSSNYVDDIYTDNFEDISGIDVIASNYLYDATNKCIGRLNSSTALTLVTNVWYSTWPNIKGSYCLFKITPPAEGYSLTASISVDGTTFFTYGNLYEYFVLNNYVFLRGDVFDIPALDNRSITFKIQSNNTNDVKINDIAVGVSY